MQKQTRDPESTLGDLSRPNCSFGLLEVAALMESKKPEGNASGDVQPNDWVRKSEAIHIEAAALSHQPMQPLMRLQKTVARFDRV